MKVDANGVVSINVSDVLESTRINPSLSILNADIASEMSGKLSRHNTVDAAALAGVHPGRAHRYAYPAGRKRAIRIRPCLWRTGYTQGGADADG